MRMNAADDHIKLRERVIAQVQRSVRQNVYFCAAKYANAGNLPCE